jgi:prevent-host-death family protein
VTTPRITATGEHRHTAQRDAAQEEETKTMSAEEARRTWRALVDRVVAGEDVVVERYARPAVAVISYEDYTAIRSELEEMRAQKRAQALRAAWQQGKLRTLPWHEMDATASQPSPTPLPSGTSASEAADHPPRTSHADSKHSRTRNP